MNKEELKELLEQVQKEKCESQTLELKSAKEGCPKRLYDSLSSFSNQDSGGIILFGVEEKEDFAFVGVYDPQDLMTQVGNQCNQMEPPVRAVFTSYEEEDKVLISAEIPSIEFALRPCFYKGAGRLTGSYVRVGDADFKMTEFEIYEFEAYRSRRNHDILPVERGRKDLLDSHLLSNYLYKLKEQRPNLAQLEEEQIYKLMFLFQEEKPTLFSWLLFSIYPQSVLPQLCINAVSYPTEEMGGEDEDGARFLDSKRIDGGIETMLKDAILFVERNTKTKIIIDEKTGIRRDKKQYPMIAIREAILNALIHRDYSEYTQSQPVMLSIFPSRIEINSPGGLYGRAKLEDLGEVRPESRNPSLVTALELLGVTENRYSGIPTMRAKLREEGQPEPIFQDKRDSFTVIFSL